MSADVRLRDAAIATPTPLRLIFDTLLLLLISLKPSWPPALLTKKNSFVEGRKIGASCAKAKPGFDAMILMDGAGPNISRNAGSNAWKKGVVVFVGFKY